MKIFQQSDLYNDDDQYLVHEIFYSIQTEGVFAGRPAVFIRLFGCNLSCSFCDTPQTKKDCRAMTSKQINKEVRTHTNTGLIVITGGEPLLHNLQPLVKRLLKKAGFYIQIETNGTITNKDLDLTQENLFLVVSPKTKKINKEIAAAAYAFKYVVKRGEVDPGDGLPVGVYRPELTTLDIRQRVMISPMFESYSVETEKNVAEAISICMKFGYYFTVQYHKLLIGIK